MMKPVRFAFAAGVMMVAGHQADACEFQKLADLHVTVENNQILIPGTLGGKNVKFLFDTSFSASLIPSGAARRLNVPVTSVNPDVYALGEFNFKDASFAEVPELTLDGFTVKDSFFRVFGSAQSANFGGPDVAALLGADFWKGYEVEVDLSHKLISLYHAKDCANSNLAYWSNSYNEVDLQRYGAQTAFSLQLDGHSLSAVLDTGTAHSTLTDKAAAKMGLQRENGKILASDERAIGSEPTDLPSLLRIGYSLGLSAYSPEVQATGLPEMAQPRPPSDYWLAHFKSLTIDQETISPFSMRVTKTFPTRTVETGTLLPANEPLHYDVLLGVDFLLSHRVLIANSQNKFYFTFTGGSAFTKPS